MDADGKGTDDELHGFTELQSIEPLAMPSLTVNVDVNRLLDDHTQEQAFEILGKLKDLFGA